MSWQRRHLTLYSFIFIVMTTSPTALSKDINQLLTQNSTEQSSSEDYFSIGIQAGASLSPTFSANSDGYTRVHLILNASQSWRDFFVEMYGENNLGLAIGYKLYRTDAISVDIIASNSYEKSAFINTGRGMQNDGGPNNREPDLWMFGLRTIKYWQDYMLQLNLQYDASGYNKGMLLSVVSGRNWQLRNWNLHATAGIEYTDSKLNDYYVGINATRAAELNTDVYQAGSGLSVSSEFGLSYPLAQNWVFKAATRATTIPDAVTDSPYFQNKRSVALSVRSSLSYVF